MVSSDVAREIKAPNNFPHIEFFNIFLGGSIEQDIAKPWQKRVVSMFKDEPDTVVLLNPRRESWDPTWKNVKTNKAFRQQVEWELEALETSDVILMYFDPATKSPISMLELGLFAHYPRDIVFYQDAVKAASKLHVICPPGFWRKGNVDIVCERYGIQQYSSLTKAVQTIKDVYGDRWRPSTSPKKKVKKIYDED